ncbi:hypothetical protein [Bifidobacterium sp. SO1]|uniref:hypothetical protein n=1 Tax=Bifidobacterium sp. SO1 TaxID=2809029 RepID=UPI001BDD3AD6|nr:hypothetical protein [Bifidobacterium sp. SO1]MBT1162939.1 hypothetical protein [Bifidobacterium sp. SO1]
MTVPYWHIEDCEGEVAIDVYNQPTVQLSFAYDEDDDPHVINLPVKEVDRLIAGLERCRYLAVANALMQGKSAPESGRDTMPLSKARQWFAEHAVYEADAYDNGEEEKTVYERALADFDAMMLEHDRTLIEHVRRMGS